VPRSAWGANDRLAYGLIGGQCGGKKLSAILTHSRFAPCR